MTSPEAKLYHGDALEVLRSLDSDSIGGLVTDPPYSSGGQFRGDRAAGDSTGKYISTENRARYEHDFAGDSRDQRSWTTWCTIWLSEAFRVTKTGGVVACFIDWRQLPALTDAIQVAGWTWRGVAPWDKGEGTRPVLGRFRAQAEYVVWGSKGPLPIDRDAPVLPGVLRCPVPRDKRHPTQKPIPMLRQVVRFVERGETVLDPFMGSGAIGAAALLEAHPFIGVELSPAYAQIARDFIAETLTTEGLSADAVRAAEAQGARLGPTQVALFGEVGT